MVVDLGDAACTCFAPLAFVGLKGAGGGLSECCSGFYLWNSFNNALVNFCRRHLAHLIGDMGVDVQRGVAGHVPNDSGECLGVHSMLQRS